MFGFGKSKKEVKSKSQLLMEALNGETYKMNEVNRLYIESVDDAIRRAKRFEQVDVNRNGLYVGIYSTRWGKEWFSKSCSDYFKSLKGIEDVELQKDMIDAYLGAYWFFLRYDKQAFTGLIDCLERDIPPLVRRYYEREFNIDIYTGTIYDKELEEANQYKEHFYRASFAYNQGKGDLELSMREWRFFLNEFAAVLEERPRAIYDFAKEVCAHQKLFMFVAYAMRAENFDKLHNTTEHAEGGRLDLLLKKINNAIYATNEDYGIFLKRYYV